jgi:hypothetical protein
MSTKAQKDRDYQKVRYAEYQKRRQAAIESFGGCCYLCPTDNSQSKHALHFHHVEYHPEESNYKRKTSAMWLRWQRLMEVEAHPERFRVLCQPCHNLITKLQQGRQIRWDRLVECLGDLGGHQHEQVTESRDGVYGRPVSRHIRRFLNHEEEDASDGSS